MQGTGRIGAQVNRTRETKKERSNPDSPYETRMNINTNITDTSKCGVEERSGKIGRHVDKQGN